MKKFLLVFSVWCVLFLMSCGSEAEKSILWQMRTLAPVNSIQSVSQNQLGVKTPFFYFIIEKMTGRIGRKIRLRGQGKGGAVLDGNRLYYGSSDYYFRCYDIAGDSLLWQYATRLPNQATPVVDYQRVYWGSVDSTVYALDKFTGQLKWKFQTQSHIYSTPLLLDTLLIIGSWDANLYALQRFTGKFLWSFAADAGIDQLPLIVDSTLWLANYDYHIYQIDVHSGKKWFDFAANNAFEFPGVARGDYLFFTGIDRKLYRIEKLNRRLQSVKTFASPISTSPLIHGNFLVTGHYDGSVIRTNLQNFKQQLFIRLKKPVDLLFLDGDLLLVVSGKQLVAIPVMGN